MILGRLSESKVPPSLWSDTAPVRGELFGIDRLEQHARGLADCHKVMVDRSRGHPLAGRLRDNAAFLLTANRAIAEAAEQRRQVTPAAEWLLDNFHLVDMQVREIGVDLPRGYYSQLPKLLDGPFVGLPRVFGLTWSLVAHTDSQFEPETLRRSLSAYQETQPLTIGELWAVPITLRIVLIENLRRVAETIVLHSAARHEADVLADSLFGKDDGGAGLLAEVATPAGHEAVSDAFAVQLAHRLRGHDALDGPAQGWLERRLAERNTTIDAVVRDELQRQGSATATIRNIINSLRAIDGIDWTEAFERVCLVNQVLAETSAFLGMDFPTRNLYRTAIENLARGSRRSELDIARRAVAVAKEASAAEPGSRRGDAGYYLLAGGRPGFERALRFHPPLQARLGRAFRGLGVGGYGGAIVLTACAFLAAPLILLAQSGMGGWWLALLAVVGVVPASDAAVACVNRAAMWGFGATALPGLELCDGIPASDRTVVAVPTLLTSRRAIAEQVSRLEIHHLASPDGELHFALLSDWTDSATEHADDDEALLAAATDGVARLNRQYGPAPGGVRFMLLHRRRVWNESERCWVGWERKRGKLHELNRLLRGAADTTFMALPDGVPEGVRYVVTLDSDTRLPRDAVRRLVGKMAHPLNRPRFDMAAGRVLEGYSVLQPRVTPSLPVGHDSTLFQRIFSSMDGIDPYAAAASDVYQDMFGEGSYAGKGIYDVDAFEAALAGRVPDSTLLSHDLFEGVFARAGLASDIEVVEEFPAGYTVSALRQHRWARGDWQLLPWIVPWTTGPGDRINAMPAIGRWKMLDNLRRSLSSPAAVVALFAGWLLPFGPALGWTGFVLATLAVPALIPVLGDIAPRRRWVSWRSYFEVLGAGLRHAATLVALLVVFLAHQAWLMGDAILRTLMRVLVSRRSLLQWVTAAQAAEGPYLGMAGTYRRMAAGPAVAGAAAAIGLSAAPYVWLLAAPFVALWLASPAIAVWASASSGVPGRLQPTAADLRGLRMTARRTWRFFETFVTPADNMLPPDNFQEDPAPVLAHRTSPTNIGLYLLSTVSAHDFGWAGLADTVDRLEATLATLGRLARFRGHYYNWYDTIDLRPLEPKYVSTVDSGNLAGHLIALSNACRSWRDRPVEVAAAQDDALNLAREELARLEAAGTVPEATARSLGGLLEGLASGTADAIEHGGQAAALARTIPAGHGDDLAFWLTAALRTAESRKRDHGAELGSRLSALERTARELAVAMEFGFLRNEDRKLLSIGFLVDEGVTDPNCYDLLASEARLAVFVAIAKGDVPAREWFRLGRAVTPAADGAALVSWSGSMFEYLMPSLVMRAPAGSLLEQTNHLVVQRQIEFGGLNHVPWGVSESAYNVRDVEYTYQYSNFGIPGLGLKRGLDQDLVIAPYATALAAMVDPVAAMGNFGRLSRVGALGRFGFYEALDYTPSRVPYGPETATGEAVAIVRAFMAHHQGMTIVAIADAVLGGIMRSRFHAEPIIQATELLLQERAPRNMTTARALPAEQRPAESRASVPLGGRRFGTAHGAAPATHLLSNGRYAVMLTSAGSGYSRWNDVAVTRWREDPTLDDWGSYIYLRDVASGRFWSAGLQPSGVEPDEYDVAFREDRAEFGRRDGELTTTLDILVSPEVDAEVRRVSISNAGKAARVIDITSYAELGLALPAADIAHPAFAKLFVETEYLAEDRAIVATRRRRAPTEPEIWAAHLVVTDGAGTDCPIEVETDRARFLGRGHGVRDPAAIAGRQPLSGSVGTVLDAVFALRCRVTIAAGTMVRVAFWTMVASTRDEVLGCIDRHRGVTAFDRASTLAWTQAQVQMRHLGISPGEADLFQRLAGCILFAGPSLRSPGKTILQGGGPQSGLWAQGISGDRPVLLLRIDDEAYLDLAREVLLAQEYMRMKQLAVDVVILNEHAASYSQDLQIALEGLVRVQQRGPWGRCRCEGLGYPAAGRPGCARDLRLAGFGGAGGASWGPRRLVGAARSCPGGSESGDRCRVCGAGAR